MDTSKKSEVYISFDVKDSSVSSFVSYLIAAFHRRGISPFVDGKSSDVEAGHKESEEERFSKLKVLVVIFSENYASHVPRLEKHIYSCRNNGDYVVVPVFYHVSISSVKQYVENSGDVLKAVQESMPKLRRCHEYDGVTSEYKFQEEIARDVFENLYPTEEIGIQSSVLEIENLLCMQPWGVRTIGIFGGRGIGKTTLARAVVRRMSGGYDDSCFFKNFQKKYNKKKLKYLPTKYLSDIAMEEFDLNCSGSEPSRRKKRVLITLDDVRNFENAMSFLGHFDNFGPGSLIIITSWDKRVLQQCEMNEIYELQGLNDEDAKKLFTRCAFGQDVTEEKIINNMMKAIKCCDGNPSDIRSYAKEFKGKTAIEMEHPMKNTFMRSTPYKEDDEQEENKQPLSDYNAVLVTTDTIIVTSVIKKDFSDRWIHKLDYNSVKSLLRHLRRRHHVIHQGLARKLQKLIQRFSYKGDLDQRELFLNLSEGVIEVVPKKTKLNGKGINAIREIRPRKIKVDRDQDNGLGLSN